MESIRLQSYPSTATSSIVQRSSARSALAAFAIFATSAVSSTCTKQFLIDTTSDSDSDSPTRKPCAYAGSGCGSELKLQVDFGIHLRRELAARQMHYTQNCVHLVGWAQAHRYHSATNTHAMHLLPEPGYNHWKQLHARYIAADCWPQAI